MFGSGGGFGGGMSFGGEKADITGGFETVQKGDNSQVKLDFSGFDSGKKQSIFSNPGAASNKAKVNMSSGGMGSGNGMAGSMFGSGNVSFNSFSGNASSNAPPAQAQTSVLSSSSGFSSFANNSSSIFGNSSFNSSQPSNQQSSSIFGGNNSNAGNSIFGNDSNTSVLNSGSATSIFGNDKSNSTSIFGNDNSNSTSIFGNPESNADSAKPSIFGNSESKPSDSLFSGGNQTTSSLFAEPKSSSLFDNQKSDSEAKSSLFSGTSLFSNSDKPPTSSSIFGKPSNSTTEEPKSTLANASPSKTTTSLFGDSNGSSLFSSATSKPADAPSIFGKSSLFSAPAANPPAATVEEGGGEKGSIQDVYRERLRKLYAEKNPDKLAKLDGFLSKYAGQEHSLYEKVCKKYNVKAQPEYKGFSSQTSVSVSFPPPENAQKEGESSSASLFPVDGPVAPAAKSSSIFSMSPPKDSGSSKSKAKEKVPLFGKESTKSEEVPKSDISSIFPPNSIFSGAEGSTMFTLNENGSLTKDSEPPKAQEPTKKEETDLTKLTLTQFVKRSNQLATQFMTPAERDMDKTLIAKQTSPEEWREYAFKRVEEIYQECAPEKVKKVPSLKTKYHGKETYLLQQICKKNKKPMELPPYPLRKEFGKVCLMPSAYLDGGAYPELHKSYEMQFPPPFNVEDNVESKAPAPKAVAPEPKAPEVKLSAPKAPEPKVQLTPATNVKQGEPSVSMSRPDLVIDQSVSISRADLADIPDVETSRPDIFINSEPGSLKKTPTKNKAEPGKTVTLTNILANSKKGTSESSSSLFETRSDIFDTRTSLLEPEKPKARLAPPKKVEKSKPKKEEKLKIVSYESSSDEDEEPKISSKIQSEPKNDPSPPQKDEMEKYKDKLRFRVDPASFDTVASSGVEHSFLDAMKFVTEQSKKISLYTLQVDDALEEFEGNRNQELNENISKLQLNMKSIIKGTNKNIDSINQVCHIYGDVESHVGQTNRIREIAKDENFRKEFEERPLTKQAKQMQTQLREQLDKVSTIMTRIEEKVADRKAVDSNKLFQINNNDNLITTTCSIGRLVQQAVQRTCEVELKVDLIKGKRNETACDLLLSKPEVNYLTGVYELKSSEKAKPPPMLTIPKAGPNKLIPLSPARKALKSPPKRLSTDYVDKMIKSFIQLKPPSVKDAPKDPESRLQEKIQESKFKSPLTVIGKVVPRKYRRRVGALSKLQEKPPDFDYAPPPPPKIVAKPPEPPPAPSVPASAPAAPAGKKPKVLFGEKKTEEKKPNLLVSAPMTAQKSGPTDAPQDAAKNAESQKSFMSGGLFGKKTDDTKAGEKTADISSIFPPKPADKPAESTSIFGKKAEEKPAEKASIFENKDAAKPAGGGLFSNNAASSGGSLFSKGGGNSGGSLFNNAASNSNANAGSETGSVYDVYKARLTEIYQAKNPSKVSKVDQFLKKYAGKEHALYSKVCKKYGMTPKAQYTPGGSSGGGMFSNKKAKVNMNMGGNSNAAPGLFNNNQNSNNNSSSIFGSNSTSSLFGNNNQSNTNNNSNNGGSIFGNNNQNNTNNNSNNGGSIFGNNNNQNNGGGIFGNNNNQNNNNNNQNQGSSLFGNNQNSGGNLFGNNNNQNNNGGMFGNNNSNNGGMFGNNSGSSIFGNNNSNNGFNSNNQQESGTVQQVYAQRLQVIYQKFAPNKLGNIPKVMQKYRGNEHAMYIKVCQKYGINPQNQYTGGNSAGSMFGGNSGGSLFGNNNSGGGMFGNSNNNNNGGMFGNNNNNSGGMFGNNNSNNSGPSGFSSFASGGSVFGGNNNSNNNHTQFFP